MKKYFKPLIKATSILSLGLTMMFTQIGGAFAQTNDPASTNGPESFYVEKANEFKATTKEIKGNEKSELIQLTQSNIQKENIKLKDLTEENLEFNDSTVVDLKNGQTLIKVPVKDSTNLEKISGVAVFVDENQNIISTYELSLKIVDSETAELKTWDNGKNTVDQILEKPDVEPQWSWSVFKSCVVNDMGFNWAIAGTIGVLCAGACVGTGGVACAPCIYAAASVTGANWGWCIGKAGRS
ncbi:hypothetical protein BM74_05635 [Bacillus thuringiensis]|uniref:Uncharacterized protein n=1 Tax=Bacillus thuringiensis TaxID=1428 RepID=A0A437SPF6_BACTU|nr:MULTISPECIES: hypothetical protein [Bacillus cereus group]MBG9539681.1 hypothetical protein [Bacillus thuringiensis]MBG9616569.1 hypothetical protein [Bacillus cereus]RVU65165.1 hypothetical protein BM74_05635 [Bacillus thuringiensis]